MATALCASATNRFGLLARSATLKTSCEETDGWFKSFSRSARHGLHTPISLGQIPRAGLVKFRRGSTGCQRLRLWIGHGVPFPHRATSARIGWPRLSAVAAGEGNSEGSEDIEGVAPRTPNELDKMRGELEALQQELDETRSKANAARDRFMRLTSAVEKKRAAAEKAVRAGDEALARRILQEKLSVLQALEKSQQRAEVLQALSAQLGKVMSRKETLYIAALSSVQRAADTSGASSAPKITIVEPSQAPPAVIEREEAAAQDVSNLVEESEGPDDLDNRFLDMERTTLERMYTQSPAADADRRSSGAPSTSSPSPRPDLSPTADLYRQEVRRQIAEVELKLAVLESDRVEKLEGRETGAERSSGGAVLEGLDGKIAKARDVLARLRQVEGKIQEGAFETSYEHDSAGKRAPWPEIRAQDEAAPAERPAPPPERIPSKKVLKAADYIRQKDQVGAANLLQQWLSEDPPEGWTWDRLAGDTSPDILTPGERADLYYAFLRHVLVPEAITEPAAPESTAAYLGAAASRVATSPSSTPPRLHSQLQNLQTFLGLPAHARDAAHSEAFREVLTSAALDSEDWALPGFDRLRAELALGSHVVEEIRRSAEAVGRYRRLVHTVLRDLREMKGGATGRSVDWELTGGQRQELTEWRDKLDLAPPSARSAAAAACRAALQELLQKVLETQRRIGGLAPQVAAELDNMACFAREAAFPTLDIAAATREGPDDSGRADSDSPRGRASSGASGASESASDSVTRSTTSGAVAARAQDLRLLVFGGDAETLLSTYLEHASSQRVAWVLESEAGHEKADDAGQATVVQEEAKNMNVLAGLLGVSAPVAGALQRSAAASAYAELSKRAMADAYVNSEARGQLDRARVVLGLRPAEAVRIEQDAAAVRIGAAAKKLLDKRARGRDVTSGDVYLLARMCDNLQAVRVAQVDSRDALVLYKCAAQTVLDTGAAPPGKLVFEGKELLRRLAATFAVTDADVRETLTAVMEAAAKAALVQARASLRQGDSSLAANDVTRLAVALAYKPEADVAKGGLPEAEARDLYSLYSSRHGRAAQVGVANSSLSALEQEMLRRLAKYLGLL